MYDFWREYQADFWPAKQLSWTISDPETLAPVTRPIFRPGVNTDDKRGDDLWHYRRVLYRKFYPEGFYKTDIIAVNWPQIDYWLKPLVGVDQTERRSKPSTRCANSA